MNNSYPKVAAAWLIRQPLRTKWCTLVPVMPQRSQGHDLVGQGTKDAATSQAQTPTPTPTTTDNPPKRPSTSDNLGTPGSQAGKGSSTNSQSTGSDPGSAEATPAPTCWSTMKQTAHRWSAKAYQFAHQPIVAKSATVVHCAAAGYKVYSVLQDRNNISQIHDAITKTINRRKTIDRRSSVCLCRNSSISIVADCF